MDDGVFNYADEDIALILVLLEEGAEVHNGATVETVEDELVVLELGGYFEDTGLDVEHGGYHVVWSLEYDTFVKPLRD